MIDYTKPYIYRRQIVATGKYYIGKHKGGDKYYKGSGIEYKQDLKLYKEYKTEILEYVDDISKLNEREEWWLQSVDAANNPLYYNKTNKSYGPVQRSEELKKLHSKFMTGRKASYETRKQMSISNLNKGIKAVLQYDLQGNFIKEWTSVTEATKLLNLSNGRISSCCRGIGKTANGYIWRFKNNPLQNNFKLNPHKSGKVTLQFDLQGNFIKEYKSASEAIRQTGIKGILQNLSGKYKTTGGFIFKYKK